MTKLDIEAINFYASHPYEFVVDFIKGADPSSQQKAVLDNTIPAMREKKGVSVKSGHSTGKCFAKGTKILMYDGSLQYVEDIRTDDKLMGDDNAPRKVLSLGRGREMMYRIRYKSGAYYDVNESHILSLVASQTHGKQKTGDITNVTVKDYLKWSDRRKRTNIGYKKSVEFNKKDLIIEPYLLGLWLGDGTSREGRITNIDKEVIDYLYTKGVSNKYKDKRNGCLTFRIKGLTTKLRKSNLLNNKHIPFDYKTTCKEDRLELLAGLIDTDGFLAKNGRNIEITQKNKQLAEDIVWLSQSVGCHATIHKTIKYCYYGGKKREGKYYRIFISRNVEKIPMKIERKKPRELYDYPKNQLHFQRSNLHFAFDVIPLGIDDYYGFEIDGNRLFLLGDFTVAHNTCTQAWLIIWFMFCYPDCRVLCTAPTQHQLLDVLWPELKKWHNKFKYKDMFEWQKTHYQNKVNPATWFAVAQTSNTPEGMQGKHEENLLVLIDEASGVSTEIVEVLEGTQTQKNNLMMMFGNPTQITGAFHDSFYAKRNFYYNYTFSSIDAAKEKPNLFDIKYGPKIASKYGLNSDIYRVRVLGDFPTAEPDTCIPLDKVEGAVMRELFEPLDGVSEIGCDVARFGDDETTIYERKGKVVKKLETFRKRDTMYTANKLANYAKQRRGKFDVIINVDDTGLGGGVTDRLNEMVDNGEIKCVVNGVNNGSLAQDTNLYANKSSEMWLWLGENIDDYDLPDDEEMIGQLSTRKYQLVSGRFVIEKKKDMKKRGLESPDRADGVVLCFNSLVGNVFNASQWKPAIG